MVIILFRFPSLTVISTPGPDSSKVKAFFNDNSSFLKAHHIPAVYLTPSEDELTLALETVLGQIEEEKRKRNLPAVIVFDMAGFSNEEDAQRREIEFQKAMLDFETLWHIRLPVKKSHTLFEVYTDADTVKAITHNQQGCSLSGYFAKTLGFEVKIGYGFGANIQQARIHSAQALALCLAGERTVLIDEKENEWHMSPWEGEKGAVLSAQAVENLKKLASQTGLSLGVLSQIKLALEKLECSEITSGDLISLLGISLRSANQYLSRLEHSGAAVVCGQKPSARRGRPTNIYRVYL